MVGTYTIVPLNFALLGGLLFGMWAGRYGFWAGAGGVVIGAFVGFAAGFYFADLMNSSALNRWLPNEQSPTWAKIVFTVIVALLFVGLGCVYLQIFSTLLRAYR